MGLVRGLAEDPGPGGARAKRWLVAGASVAGAVLVAAGVVAAVAGSALWPSGQHQQGAAPQARQYLNATACLLTDPGGITPGAAGAPVWQAMQSASLATHVMVSYVPDNGPSTAAVMLSSLMERKCGVIIATGTPAVQVIRAAKTDRHQDFVLVATSAAAGRAGTANLVVVSPAAAPVRVDQAIRTLAAQARPSGS